MTKSRLHVKTSNARQDRCDGHITGYKRVYRYRSGETVNFPQADLGLGITSGLPVTREQYWQMGLPIGWEGFYPKWSRRDVRL